MIAYYYVKLPMGDYLCGINNSSEINKYSYAESKILYRVLADCNLRNA